MRPGIRKGARFLNSPESVFLWEEVSDEIGFFLTG